MAFYNEKDEDEEQQGGQQVGGESGVVGSGAAGGAQAAVAGGASSKPEPFVGISQYINANKPQSEKLANQVVGNINTKAQNVDSALNSAQNSFNQAADAQKVQGNDDLLNEIKTDARGVASDANKK